MNLSYTQELLVQRKSCLVRRNSRFWHAAELRQFSLQGLGRKTSKKHALRRLPSNETDLVASNLQTLVSLFEVIGP